MNDTGNTQSLQTQYLLEIERAKLDSEMNGGYTAEGLRHLTAAAKIQYQLSTVTTGNVSAQHLRMSRELAQSVQRQMQALGYSDEKMAERKPAPAPDTKTSPAPDTPKKKEERKSANGELDGFNVEDFIVKPGAVSIDDAEKANPAVVEALKNAVYDNFLTLFPNIKGYTGLTVRHRMLYGPPGSGKTYICKGLSTYMDKMYPDGASCFFLLPCSEIKSKFVGTAEHRIREVFKAASEYVFSIICIDEVDALCPPRGNDDKVNYTTTLLELIDGVQGKSESMVILATNHPENVDPALISRIGNRDFVDYSSHAALEDFLRGKKSIEQGLGASPEARERMIQKLALIAEENHFSFRNMNVLCDGIMTAMKRKLLEKYQNGSEEVTTFLPLSEQELLRAIDSVNTDFDPKGYAKLIAYRDKVRN